eukprot:gene10303-biopygen4769
MGVTAGTTTFGGRKRGDRWDYYFLGSGADEPGPGPRHSVHRVVFRFQEIYCMDEHFCLGNHLFLGYGGAAGAAREENEGNAAPQALPGARTRATPQRYVLLCYVLPCSVMFCAVLVHPVLSCSVLFWASLTSPNKQTQTNTTQPQHHTIEPSDDQKCNPAPRAPGESGGTSAQGAGGIDKSAPKAPGK